MTVSVEEIDRWDAGDVREVFHATRSRAEAAFQAANGIAQLPAFGTWGGEASEAAKEAVERTRKDLDAHGQEALAVAQAASRAVDDVEQVKSDLAQLRADAKSMGMIVDPVSNTIEPGPGAEGADPMEIVLKQMQLQPRLDAIFADAARADQELAQAIAMATGEAPIPDTPHTNDPGLQDALSRPLPEDPKQFHDLWEKLSPEQREWLYSQDHHIGNHPGMPFVGDHTDPGRDYFNRRHLGELTQSAQTEVDRLRREHPAWANGVVPNPKGNMQTSRQWQDWKKQWDSTNHTLDGYEAVNETLGRKDGVPRYLGLLDDQRHAAVSIGNPDTATRTATLVPGTGQDMAAFTCSDGKSLDMYNATMQADRSLRAGDVAVTTWMGYDRPMDLAQAASSSYANNGAGALDSYLAGVQASHDSGIPLAIDTVVGHSYGSTLVGAAGAGGHHLAADNVIAVGSPGRARVRSEPRPRWPRLCHTRTARHHSPGGRCRSGAQPHLGRVRRCRTPSRTRPRVGAGDP